jgi:hypothetical protein
VARRPNGRERRVIERAARAYGIEPSLLWGVFGAESNFGRNKNRSSAGAQGPFQFMPATAKSYGINPYNFKQAANAAAKYLSTYIKDRGVEGALAAYNAGPAGNPNNPETRAYIPKVLQLAKTWGGGSVSQVSIPDTDAAPPVVGSTYELRSVTKTDTQGAVIDALLDHSRRSPGQGLLRNATERISSGQYTTTENRRVRMPGSSQEPVSRPTPRSRAPRAGGGYGGTEGVVRGLASPLGLPVTSAKRPTKLTASGNISDHWEGNKNAYAEDLGGSKAQMDRAFRRLNKRLGGRLKYNTINNLTIDGVRVQIIYGPKVGHGDHIHIGASV